MECSDREVRPEAIVTSRNRDRMSSSVISRIETSNSVPLSYTTTKLITSTLQRHMLRSLHILVSPTLDCTATGMTVMATSVTFFEHYWVKGCVQYSSLRKIHCRATKHHLPHRITQCYSTCQAATREMNVPTLIPARKAGTQFTYLRGMES